MIGRVDKLNLNKAVGRTGRPRASTCRAFFTAVTPKPGVAIHHKRKAESRPGIALDHDLIAASLPSIDHGQPVRLERSVRNVDRTVGAMLSGEVARRYGHAGLPEDTISIKFTGTVGQSFGAFLARGISIELTGDANDYVGKGLSGGPHRGQAAEAGLVRDPAKNIIVGNTVLYGAIAGEAYFHGVAGERFAVRNSGAICVVEGTGDHGCEYMTGGVVAVLGKTGRNFAAGMSGGVAYVFDEVGDFEQRCNHAMVKLEKIKPADGAIEHAGPAAPAFGQRGRSGHGRSAALRRRAAAHPGGAPPAPHRQRARQAASGQLGGEPRQIHQGDADRLRQGIDRHEGACRHRRGIEQDMGKITGFLEIERSRTHGEKPEVRINNYKEFVHNLPAPEVAKQAARCMDCGIPFCHNGCPVNNLIPDWNNLVYRDQWRTASENLHSTNNFPEFTGRICPAPLRGRPAPSTSSTARSPSRPSNARSWTAPGKKAGSSRCWPPRRPARPWRWWAPARPAWRRPSNWRAPATASPCLKRADRIGGLLRYGIPDFKMEKHLIDRRVRQMEAEGVVFRTNVEVGVTSRWTCCRPIMTRWSCRAAPKIRATCR